MKSSKAFHNNLAAADKYIIRLKRRIAAGTLRQRYALWKNDAGCAVGCTIESNDFSAYERELGIPDWLARVKSTLFENMGAERSRSWPLEFLESCKTSIGKDLDSVKAPYILSVLGCALGVQEANTDFDAAKYPDVAKAIEGSKEALKNVIALWQRYPEGPIGCRVWRGIRRAVWRAGWKAANRAARRAYSADSNTQIATWSTNPAAWKAAKAASSAASAAMCAAWAAARKTAHPANGATRSAENAVSSAGWIADSGARAAVCDAKFEHLADELLQLIERCPAPSGRAWHWRWSASASAWGRYGQGPKPSSNSAASRCCG